MTEPIIDIKQLTDDGRFIMPGYSCPKCGDDYTYCIKSGPHIKWMCEECGYIKFLEQPWNIFVMFFGKYKGKTLDWIYLNDPIYLTWVKNNTCHTSLNKKFAQMIRAGLL